MLLARLWSILRIKAWWYFGGGARLWAQDTAPEVEGVPLLDRGAITNEPGGVLRIRPIAPTAGFDATGYYRPRFNAFDGLPIGGRDD